jgi:hypothetical protein
VAEDLVGKFRIRSVGDNFDAAFKDSLHQLFQVTDDHADFAIWAVSLVCPAEKHMQ